MSTIDVRVGDAAENREIVAVFVKELQVGRKRVVATGGGGEKAVGQKAEIVANGKNAAGGSGRFGSAGGAAEGRAHGIEKRQRQQHSGAAQKLAPRDSALRGNKGRR